MINSKTNLNNTRRLRPDRADCTTETCALRHPTDTSSENEDPKTCNDIPAEFANVQEATDRCHGSYIVNTELSADCFELPNTVHVQDMSIPPFPIKSIKTEERQVINEVKTDNVKENKTSNKHYHEKREQAAFINHEKIIQTLIKQRDSLSGRIHCSNTSKDIKNQIIIDILERQIREYRSHWFVYGVSKSTATQALANDKTELSKQLEREIYRLESHLPIFAKRPEIDNYLSGGARVVIIHGQSGCGKSTQVPQYVADHPQFNGKSIICTQPQKAAAICLANRISFEYNAGKGIPLFDQIGYEVEGLKKEVRNCRIEVLTEGALLNKIAEGSLDIFKNVGCVIIDEAQERRGNCDILLGYLKTEISLRKDLFLIIISMTNDLAQYFGGAPCVEVGNIIFPRDIDYRPLKENDQIANVVAQCALDIHVNQGVHSGDILCFLPGDQDVFMAHRIFERKLSLIKASHNVLKTKCLVIHEKIEVDQLANVFVNLGPMYRKIIFSTNVIETSINVGGIDFVIDCGVKREIIFDPALNDCYETVSSISKTSATQRAEKCGMAQKGSCYLLYSQSMFANLQTDTQPNIHKMSLTLAVLTLRKLKIDPNKFDWINAPSKRVCIAAEKELKYLGALDTSNVPSGLGELILKIQLEPRMVKMIYSGCRNGFGYAAIKLASAMYVSDFIFWPKTDKQIESKNIVPNHVSDNSFPECNIASLYKHFDTWMNIWHGADQRLEAQNLIKGTNKKTESHRERNVSDWCSKNFINGEAMKLAYSFRKHLISQFKDTKVWRSVLSQSKTPSDTEICWLACTGYFLNVAVLDDSKNSKVPIEYVAIQSDIRGTLEKKITDRPHWILYHKIIQSFTNTTFSFTNMIDISWIREENLEFYELCKQKEMKISRTIITKNISPECLQLIFGKGFINLKGIEKLMDCRITVESSAAAGRVDLQCTKANKDATENAIDAKICAAVSELEKQIFEVEYLNGTSVIIGKGFEVLDVLFPQEYATLYITNLPKECSYSNLKSLLTERNESLGNLEIQDHLGQHCTAMAKFCNKKDAKSAYERLSNKIIENKNIEVFPKFGATRPISQAMSTYLKLSWALEISNGLATIEFYAPQEANNCIENIGNILPQARIIRVHGRLQNSKADGADLSEAIKLLPQIFKIRTLINSTECKFRFIISTEKATLEEIKYKITIAGLPLSMDECELKQIIRHHNPKCISVSRGTGRMERLNHKFNLTPNEKKEKLAPLLKLRKFDITAAEFLESKTHRAGIYIYFKNNYDAIEAFNQADYKTLRKECDQPHRLEIEYAHSVSIHEDLLKIFDQELTALKMKAYKKWILTTETNTKGSKIVIFRFKTNRQSNILWVQEQLQNIFACTKFKDPTMDVLFTWAGKQEMASITDPGLFHWNWNDGNKCIVIYGSPELKEKKEREIKNIIEYLSSLEVLDKIVHVDTDTFGVHHFNSACKKSGVSLHHLLDDKLYLSGSEDAVKKIENYLRQSNMLRIPNQEIENSIEIRPCGLCFCVPDKEFLITILCHHLFCIDCLRGLLKLKPAPSLPIVCPAERCQIPISIDDILKCGGINSLRSILEVSVFNYKSKHSTEILPCPKPGCGQILSHQSITTGQNGGDFLYCDECVTTYCLTCSKKCGKPTKSHDISNCEDVQNGTYSQIANHIKEIRENCLNLKCPRCDMTFMDFEGCAAVKCERCKCGFCGLCLQDCGVDAHSHVFNCPKNTTNGVYIEAGLLNNIHKSKRKRDVRNYISKITDHKVNNKVCEAIQENLYDLGIEKTFIRSLFVTQNTTDPVSFDIQQHIQIIQDKILNLTCPRCLEQFFEFDGSVAVKCDRCNCAFCALCMNDCEKFDDIKRHIEICPKNLPRTLFVAKHIFDDIHRSTRKKNLKKYVEKFSNTIIQKGVCTSIEKDLVDLGIEKSFIMELIANDVKPPTLKKLSTNTQRIDGRDGNNSLPKYSWGSCGSSGYTSAAKHFTPNVYLMTAEEKDKMGYNPQQQQVMMKNKSASRLQAQSFSGLNHFPSLRPPKVTQNRERDKPTYAQILNRRAEPNQPETSLVSSSVTVEQSRHVTNNEDFILLCLVSSFCLYMAFWFLM